MDITAKIKKRFNQMNKGIKVEKEHTGTFKWLLSEAGIDPKSAKGKKLIKEAIKKTVRDHLNENKSYYTLLLKQGL